MKIIAVACCLSLAAVLAVAEDTITFNRDIRPILSNKCFACHGPSEGDRKGKLRLDRTDGPFGARTARGDKFIIKPGDPDGSALWHRVTTADEDDRMPPADSHKEPLTEDELAAVRQWIQDGGEYQPFWSFIPPRNAPPAEVSNPVWGESIIDNRVLARLEDAGLQPKSESDRRTLLRRVTFDLTGLPPTLEEIDAFLADDSPQAYEHLVERLIGRESYGEHMARYWADLVRLGDTNGMHKDYPRDFSTYRDWLIRAFNENLPFDDFLMYQLAGDLYDDPSRDQLIASGFNRLHLIIDVGTALPEESLHKNVLDRVEAFGTVFLGLTVQCAQCHDHKYDPISQKEYFQLYAFFNNFSGEPETERTVQGGLQPPLIYLTSPEQEQQRLALEARKARLTNILQAIQGGPEETSDPAAQLARVPVPWIWNNPEGQGDQAVFQAVLTLDAVPEAASVRFTGMSAAEVRINGTPLGRARALNRGIIANVRNLLIAGDNVISARAEGTPGFAFLLEYTVAGESRTFTSGPHWEAQATDGTSWQAASTIHNPDHKSDWTEKAEPENVASIRDDIREIDDDTEALLSEVRGAMVMGEREPPRPTTVLIRGAYDAPGEPVERNTPAFLPPMQAKEGMYSRMDLAEWIVSPENPLTARVAVNRIWQQFFGVGLVKTSEDFGAQGEWPSHPDLLDDLALRFVASGWNLKALVRDIVLSHTYRQRSEASPEEFRKDPENRLLARGSRFRMDAEMIRDQILAVSGQLNRTMYGKSVKPPQPPGLWEMVSMAEPMTYVADTDDNIYRRSLYTYWRRGIPPPQMTIMNAPSREFCLARRERTNTPLQALLLMNEQEYFKAAKACVMSTLTEDTNEATGLGRIYEKITSHVPSPERLALMKETLQEFRAIYANDRNLTESLTPDLGNAPFEKRVDVAAWTMLTHSLLNLELAKVRS